MGRRSKGLRVRVSVRMSTEQHERAVQRAEELGMQLTDLLLRALDAQLQPPILAPVTPPTKLAPDIPKLAPVITRPASKLAPVIEEGLRELTIVYDEP